MPRCKTSFASFGHQRCATSNVRHSHWIKHRASAVFGFCHYIEWPRMVEDESVGGSFTASVVKEATLAVITELAQLKVKPPCFAEVRC
jgi:hypothetical protein